MMNILQGGGLEGDIVSQSTVTRILIQGVVARGVVVETLGRHLHSRIIAIAINIINTWW